MTLQPQTFCLLKWPMQHYQWLLFDADGTLFDHERAESVALDQVFRSIGVVFDPSYLAVYQRINQGLWRAVETGELTPEVVKVRRFEMLLQTIGVRHPAAAFSATYLRCLADCTDLIEGAAETLEVLQEKYRLAILTNGFQIVQRRKLAQSVIRQHIGEIIISEEIGVSQTGQRIFQYCAGSIGTPLPGTHTHDWRWVELGHAGRDPLWNRCMLVQSTIHAPSVRWPNHP